MEQTRSRLRVGIFAATCAAILACCAVLCQTPGEILYLACVPVFALYIVLFRRQSLRKLSVRHGIYVLLLTVLMMVYMLGIAQTLTFIRIRWSELFVAMYFLLGLHIVLYVLDRLFNRLLCWAFRISPIFVHGRRFFFKTVARVAMLILVGGPLVAASLSIHWIKFAESTDPQQLYGLRYETVGFHATDGVGLSGWFLPAQERISDSSVILAPGRGMGKACFLPYAKMLHDAGYNVFILDLRGEGSSEGRSRGFGALEAMDVLGAVQYLRQVHPQQSQNLFALGVSHGASAVIAAAGQDNRIQAVVAESAFPVPVSEVRAFTSLLPGPVQCYFENATLAIASAELGHNLFRAGARESIAQISPRPVLLIHGRKDDVVSLRDAEELYAASGKPVMLWSVPGAGHAESLTLSREGYSEVVSKTFKSVQLGLPPFQWTHKNQSGG